MAAETGLRLIVLASVRRARTRKGRPEIDPGRPLKLWDDMRPANQAARFRFLLTAPLRVSPALNLAWVLAGILIASPVCGLRP